MASASAAAVPDKNKPQPALNRVHMRILGGALWVIIFLNKSSFMKLVLIFAHAHIPPID